MERFIIFFILLIYLVKNSIGNVVCYQCYANSTISGTTCSIDKVCISSYCIGVLYPNMTWHMDCGPEDGEPPSESCTLDSDTKIVSCYCENNFCNSIDKILPALSDASGVTGNASVILPHRNLTCLECGQVLTKDGVNHTIPCTAESTCLGVQCLTSKRLIFFFNL
uniref:Activin_recp domain-containing protein n=1 Tax=Strongyloides papillosus TaxID=174720 RepID=A0A0N5B7D3_STREA